MTDVLEDYQPLHLAPSRTDAVESSVDAPSKRVLPRDVFNAVGQGLTIFGLLIVLYAVYLIGLSRLEHGRSQKSLLVQFDEALAFGEAPIGGRIAEGTPVALLEIPELGVRETVVEGTSGEQLKKGPGHLRSSPLPGQRGNAVIAGRRIAYGGPFRRLDQLQRGDVIRVTTGQGRAVYVVTGAKEVAKDDKDVLDNVGENRLTLVTSAPEVVASRRLVATATLRTPAQPAPAGRPTEVRRSELGLHRDGSTALPLMLWTEALLIAALGSALLYRRWKRWPAWLLTTPVLALLLLLVFDSFTPLLPSTL